MTTIDTAQLKQSFMDIQQEIVAGLEKADGGKFLQDKWQKEPESLLQGEGNSCIIQDSHIFEKGGVAFSHVKGHQLPMSATAVRPQLAGRSFEAMGVSMVLHPRNPYIPTVHINVRCFMAFKEGEEPVWWFGGGMDLTPYYGDEQDCRHFHQTCKDAVDPFGSDLYDRMKKQCDEYFFLKHRGEARGIGGIFFDDFDELGFEKSRDMTFNVGRSFLKSYIPIIEKHRNDPYSEKEREFQAFRRGRYVEFNLVFDRGTLFGLQTGGRTESILLSMPPIVRWGYQWHPEAGSKEEKLYTDFLPPRDWLA